MFHMAAILLDVIVFFIVVFSQDKRTLLPVYRHRQYVRLFVYSFSTLLLFGFSWWFAHITHQILKETRIQQRTIELATFSFIQSVMFAVEFGYALHLAINYPARPVFAEMTIFFKLIGIAILTIRCLICLMELGIEWPSKYDKIRVIVENAGSVHSSQIVRVYSSRRQSLDTTRMDVIGSSDDIYTVNIDQSTPSIIEHSSRSGEEITIESRVQRASTEAVPLPDKSDAS